MDPEFEAFLRAGDVSVGADDITLLRTVAREGSLNAAASALGRSYSRCHSRVSELETEVGPLISRRRGGSGGGGSQLTDEARALIARFDRLVAALEGTALTETVELHGEVIDREGTIATVETDAGRLQAVLAEPAERVRVTLRADSVTVHDPAGVPAANETSARNRFSGTVTTIDRSDATAHVGVDIGVDEQLTVQVTSESLDTLEVSSGDTIVASFKATATRAIPVDYDDYRTNC